MKCRYFEICRLAKKESIVCYKDGGGNYCGHFRSLFAIENRNSINKKKIKNLNKLLKYMNKTISFIEDKYIEHFNEAKNERYHFLKYDIEQNINLIRLLIMEIEANKSDHK
jgi:hypothetical protein